MFIKHNTNTGFTLIELLVTISIIVILTFIGVPTFKSVTNNSRISATNNSLVGNLALARSEAVNRNAPVSVCASSDGSSCTGTAWELGWIVFTDGGTAGTVDGSDKILRVQNKTIGRLTVTASGPYVRFKPGGQVALGEETTPSILARLLHSLLPGKDAWASEGDDTSTSSTDSDSSSSDSDSTSGSGGSGGATLMSCVAPASAVGGPDDTSTDSTSSDSNSSDSASSDSANSDSNSGDSQSSDSASSDDNSGSSTASSGSAGSATCDGQPLAANSFLICDASKANEIGNLVTVTNTGRISQIKVRCN